MSGDYTKITIGSSLPCSHQIIKCIKLDEGRFVNEVTCDLIVKDKYV